MSEYIGKEHDNMDKAQAITLLYLLKSETPPFETLSDYIQQFEVIEENVRSLLDQRKES